VLAGTGCGARLESNLLALWLNIQLGSGHLDFVALLAHAFVSNIVALIFIFFFVLLNLQMPINESGREFVLRDCGCKQFRNPTTQKWLFENFSHRRSLRGILNQHQLDKVFEILRVVGGDLRVASSKNFKNKSFHRISVECMSQSYHLI